METLQPKLRFPEFAEKYINKRVDDFAPLQRGFDLPITKMVKGKFPVVFSNGTSKTHNEFKVKAPGIVTGRSGTIGNLFYIEENFWPHNTSLWVTDFKGNFPKYVYYFYDKFDLKRFGTGSGVPTLNRNDVHNQQIYIPSPEEQTKIAIFLSSVDEKLKLLKEKKALLEEYKKGIMQKIFNQEIRFKNDNGENFEEWQKIILSEVFDYKKGSGLSKDKLEDNGDNSCILYGQLYTKYSEVIFEVKSKTNSNEGLLSEKGDLLIPASTTTSGIDLANVTALNFDNVLLGGDITVLRSNQEVSSVFYAYYLSNYKKEEIASYAQGITIVHLYYSHIKDMIIDFPSIEEQTKIANFLSAIDKKIVLVTTQIEDTQEYKKGLLQQMFV